MIVSRRARTEPVPGYQLLELLGKGAHGEVWKCVALDGRVEAVKFLPSGGDSVLGMEEGTVEQELRFFQQLETIRHPFILVPNRVEVVAGELLLFLELAERSLLAVLQEARREGRPGIPRLELLRYLRQAAEALDVMNFQHGLLHQGVKPTNLLLFGTQTRVADFGLFGRGQDFAPGQLASRLPTDVYAAPEAAGGRFCARSDQYSLAVTYHELLTGVTPFRTANRAEERILQSSRTPDLSRLPAVDRGPLTVALAPDPERRFPSCLAFVEALEEFPAVSVPAGFHPGSGDVDLGSQPAGGIGTSSLNDTRGEFVLTPVSGAGDLGALAGFQFVDCLHRVPGADLWRARDVDGREVLVRCLPPEGAVDRLAIVQHRHLAPFEILPSGSGRFALVTSPGDGHLGNRLRACQARGEPGVPRAELLSLYSQAASALDDLAQTYHLAHLTLSPRALGVREEQAALLDFGLAQLCWLPAGIPPVKFAPKYTAPEMFGGEYGTVCDQYSLALIYQEMLVGLHPFRNLSARQISTPRLRGQPDLSMLPIRDRVVVRKALHPNPDRRFASCLDFAEALLEAQPEVESVSLATTGSASRADVHGEESASYPEPEQDWTTWLRDLLAALARPYQIRSHGDLHYLLNPGRRIEHRCRVRLVPETVGLKLAGFCETYLAEQQSVAPNCFVYTVRRRVPFWKRLFGPLPGLDVVVQVRPAQDAGTPLLITLQPVDCGAQDPVAVLDEMGSQVLGALQTYLQGACERSEQERFPYPQPVQLWVPGRSEKSSRMVSAQCRDLGRMGATLFINEPLPPGVKAVQLTRWGSVQTFRVPCRVVSVEPVTPTHLEVEVAFGE